MEDYRAGRKNPHGPLGAARTMTRSRVVRMRATGVGHVTQRDVERVRDEMLGIGPGSSGRRDGVGTGRGTSHNSLRESGQALEWFQDFGWLQGHQSGFRGLMVPGGEWLQVVSGSRW